MVVGALFIDLLTREPAYYFSIIIAVVISVVLHELSHGVAAIWQGDDTPRATGHMTWNPLVHMGGFSLFLLFFAGIAYGLMPASPGRFRSRSGRALVALAGPAANLVLAFIGLTVFAVWIRTAGLAAEGMPAHMQDFFFTFGQINLILFLFNLLPLPPLDGSTVLGDFSPGYRRMIANPNNQPIFTGAFLLIFFFFDGVFAAADSVALAYLRWWLAP